MKAVVLGCGMVGRTIALDLAADYEVTVIDLNRSALEDLAGRPGLRSVTGSALDPAIVGPEVEAADVVCGAVPGRLGYGMLEMLVKMGRPVADISFMPEDFMALDGPARERGIAVVPDFGVAPGMCHLLVGRGAHLLDEVEEARILVGGIPADPEPPWNFKVVFSPEDTIDEYNRPVRMVEDGRVVEVPALSGLETIEFPGVGTLEAFYTDGLRSLVKNVKAPLISEKTMRWPGHATMMEALREAGFFDPEEKEVAGCRVAPLKFTSELLFKSWKMNPARGDRDMTLMRVMVRGKKGNARVTHTWDLRDYFHEESGQTSMARTTGFPCALMARALAQGMIPEKGVLAPETLAGNDELFGFIMSGLKERGIKYVRTVVEEKNAL